MNFFRTTDTTDTTIWKPGFIDHLLAFSLLDGSSLRGFFFLFNDQLPRISTMTEGNCFLVTIKSSKGFIKYNQYNGQICYSRKFVLFQEHILVRGMPEQMPIVNLIQGLEFQILLFLSEKHVCKRQHYSHYKSWTVLFCSFWLKDNMKGDYRQRSQLWLI